MDSEQVITFLITGCIAGWLAGAIMKGGGLGFLGNLLFGIVGAFVGGWLFDLFEISIGGEWLGPIVTATVGAMVLIYLIGFIKR